MQIGHQACSSGHVDDATQILASGNVGKVTAIHAHMFRNTPHGKPQWARPVTPDMTPEAILWPSFLGAAPPKAFDANRYVNWRFFWDYSGGNVYENMCHQVAFWYKVMNLQIPKSVNMAGGIYLVERRPRSSGHDVGGAGTAGRSAVHVGFRLSATASWALPKMCSARTAPSRAASRSGTRRRR